MDTLFLILIFITGLAAIGTIIALIQYLLERVAFGWVLALSSLTISIAASSMVIFAMWKVFGWWFIAMIFVTVAQGFLTIWISHNPEFLDKPIYRVGGRRADLH